MPLNYDLFPPELLVPTQKALDQLGFSLTDGRRLAECVLKLSDFYIQNPRAETPWQETWAQVAYLVYFHPLNLARNSLVVQRGNAVGFFAGLESALDFGAGLGAASSALKAKTEISQLTLIERSQISRTLLYNEWSIVSGYDDSLMTAPEKTLSVFSYSFTELKQWPEWVKQSEAVMILDPATAQDGRRLLELRQKLIDQGFHIWAPCLHQEPCPLLTKSKTDWCHDRAAISAPAWYTTMESHLPMRNLTVTTSYLLARRKAPQEKPHLIRLVGDHLKEKGKSRQMICRGPDREFLSWLHRDGTPPVYPRGDLLEMPTVELRGNELRVLIPIPFTS